MVSRRGPQDAWLSEIHVVSKAVRGHWPLEGSNPSPSPQNPFIQGRFLGCLDWMLLRRRCRSRHRCSHGKPRFSAEWFRLLHREGGRSRPPTSRPKEQALLVSYCGPIFQHGNTAHGLGPAHTPDFTLPMGDATSCFERGRARLISARLFEPSARRDRTTSLAGEPRPQASQRLLNWAAPSALSH